MIAVAWFCLVAAMLAIYVVLDGFDLGAGVVHLFVARTDEERDLVIRSIGPFWDGNEVWLIAAGGTLYFAFPALYASAFSGFYLALTMVLWLLILRGISIEFRHHTRGTIWLPLWDIIFGGSSALLALLFGVALGNVIRGVPIDQTGYFFLPLWTNLLPGRFAGAIDWYTLLIGLAALTALALHAMLWVIIRTAGPLADRARLFFRGAWWILAAGTIVITAASFQVQPAFPRRFLADPWGCVFPVLAVAGLIGMRVSSGRARDGAAFVCSCLYLAGMLASAAFSLFPNVLPSNVDTAQSLTVYNAAAPEYGLQVGLWWWIPGMLLAAGYAAFVYRRFSGKSPAATV